jgi:hypothetical protein
MGHGIIRQKHEDNPHLKKSGILSAREQSSRRDTAQH